MLEMRSSESYLIKDKHLYLFYDSYPYGVKRLIIPLDEIKEIKEETGTKGGHLGWSIIDKDDNVIMSFGRKHKDLLRQLREVWNT